MAASPIRLIRQYRVKYAQGPDTAGQQPNPNPPAQAKPAGFMDAVVPPALALGATGILIGVLFDRKHGLFAGTSAALGLLGTAIGAAWGAMRSVNFDQLAAAAGGLTDMLGIRDTGGTGKASTWSDEALKTLDSWVEWGHRGWTPYVVGTAAGAGIGARLGWQTGEWIGRGVGEWLAERFSWLAKLKKLGLFVPTLKEAEQIHALVKSLGDATADRVARLKEAIDILRKTDEPLHEQVRQVRSLLTKKFEVDLPSGTLLHMDYEKAKTQLAMSKPMEERGEKKVKIPVVSDENWPAVKQQLDKLDAMSKQSPAKPSTALETQRAGPAKGTVQPGITQIDTASVHLPAAGPQGPSIETQRAGPVGSNVQPGVIQIDTTSVPRQEAGRPGPSIETQLASPEKSTVRSGVTRADTASAAPSGAVGPSAAPEEPARAAVPPVVRKPGEQPEAIISELQRRLGYDLKSARKAQKKLSSLERALAEGRLLQTVENWRYYAGRVGGMIGLGLAGYGGGRLGLWLGQQFADESPIFAEGIK